MARRSKSDWTVPEPITVEIDGEKHTGHFQLENGMIRVSYKSASKTTHLGGSARSPAALAKLMLHELIRETPRD